MTKKTQKTDYKKEHEEVTKQKEEYLKDLQRLQAEFENYKKRSDTESSNHKKYANEDLIKTLLPLLDSFELALKHSQDSKDFEKGTELIYAQLISTLEKQGLRPIKTEGQKFDPYKHEVLLTAESDKEDLVLEELQKGYMLNEKVIRHSKVKIGKVKKNGN